MSPTSMVVDAKQTCCGPTASGQRGLSKTRVRLTGESLEATRDVVIEAMRMSLIPTSERTWPSACRGTIHRAIQRRHLAGGVLSTSVIERVRSHDSWSFACSIPGLA